MTEKTLVQTLLDEVQLAIADGFQVAAHGSVNQKRKYSGEPYHVHPRAVMMIMVNHGSREFDVETLQAALLHDVVEDTPIGLDLIASMFGSIVAGRVHMVSSPTKDSKENRASRRAVDHAHYALGDADSQSIKVADSIQNLSDIMVQDPNFARVYVYEKESLLEALTKADQALRDLLAQTIMDCHLYIRKVA